MMALSVVFGLVALAIVFVVLVAGVVWRGLKFGLVAGGLALVGMFALYVAAITVITAQM